MINDFTRSESDKLPKVSVVIPHFGDPKIPLALIESLRSQKGVNTQIILVDDASPIIFPETKGVRVVRRTINGGFGSTVNVGVVEAIHPLLLILNSDLSISDTFISEIVSESTPWQPAVTGPQIIDHTGTLQWSGRHFPTVLHQTVEWLTPLARWRSKLHTAVGHNTECVTGSIVPVDWLMGAVLLMPTAVFRSAGGFDEDFYMNCEEVDLQRRLLDSGVSSVFLGTVTATHTGGGSSPSAQRRRWIVDSRFRYAAKWGNPRLLRTSLYLASTANFAANCVRQTLGRNIDATSVFRAELSYLRQEKP